MIWAETHLADVCGIGNETLVRDLGVGKSISDVCWTWIETPVVGVGVLGTGHLSEIPGVSGARRLSQGPGVGPRHLPPAT